MVFLIKGKCTEKKTPIRNPICRELLQQAAHIRPNKLRQPVVETRVGEGNAAICF